MSEENICLKCRESLVDEYWGTVECMSSEEGYHIFSIKENIKECENFIKVKETR